MVERCSLHMFLILKPAAFDDIYTGILKFAYDTLDCRLTKLSIYYVCSIT